MHENTAETIFNRLDDHGKTWKIYVAEPQRLSGTGLAHFQRLKDRLATHVVPFAEFETDAASGNLPDFCVHRAVSDPGTRRLPPGVRASHGARRRGPRALTRPRRSLAARHSSPGSTTSTRACSPRRAPTSGTRRLLIGWDEPGGTYDHVPPPAVPPPDPSAPAGQHGFTFDRSGYRVPAIIVSPWVAEGEVFNEEYRHTSLIATLRETMEAGRRRSPHEMLPHGRSPTSSPSTRRETRKPGRRPSRVRCPSSRWMPWPSERSSP